MLFMTSYKQGDVLLVPFPFTDQSGSKQRPAIVISSAKYNQIHPDVILAPITSHPIASTDELAILDWKLAGLLKPSVVKPILSSFDTRLVKRKLGNFSSTDKLAVRELFARLLDLR
jgi:mRNA interferase MazF